MGSPLRALIRLVLYVAWTLPLLPVQAIAVALDLRLARRLPGFYHRVCCAIMGIEIRSEGKHSTVHPTLYVCNHASYLDIEVLSAQIDASFVAKSEIADWPFFGLLAKLQRSVFVDRRVTRAGAHRDQVATRLAAGDDLILFPEGTSTDGNRVRPFKSSLFAVAQIRIEDRPVTVQPVTIAYTKLDGIPLGRALRPFVAWYGEMEIASHGWVLLGLGRLTAEVVFHQPVTFDTFGTRKALSDHCYKVIAEGVATANSGRPRVKSPEQAKPVGHS